MKQDYVRIHPYGDSKPRIITSEEKTALIGALALSAGRHLGFTAEELIGTLKNPDDKYTRKAIELVARLAIESKEYQKHGETRND